MNNALHSLNKSTPISLNTVESILQQLASFHVPVGSEVKAVVHQWAHALATNSQFFVLPAVNSAEKAKKEALSILKESGVYTTRQAFYDLVFNELALKPVFKPKFRFIDLFAGIGGMRLGAQFNSGACVFSSECDLFAQQTYQHNYGEWTFGNITKIAPEAIPDHDLLVAGFPCQPFSYSGRCEGFEDRTRGTLFFDIIRILEAKKPKFVILENVKGFKSHSKGETMFVALSALKEAGYKTSHGIINSYDYGVPQYRERWYCVAVREDLGLQKFKFDYKHDRTTTLGDIVDVEDDDESLRITDFEIDRIKFHFDNYHENERVKHDNSKYAPHTKKGKHGVYSFLKPDKALRFHVGDFAKTQIQEAFYACLNTYAPTIIANRVPKLWDIRRKLSVQEANKLQGFPESFVYPVSKAQSYKQIGNAVTVPVIQHIVKTMINQYDI